MKILLINVVKDKGSTGNIVTSLFKGYKELGHTPYLIYGRGDKPIEENIFKPTIELESKIHHLLSMFTGNMYGGMHISTRRIIKQINRIKPDIIHLHCLNGYFVNMYKLLSYLKRSSYKVILTVHADFMITSNCGYSGTCNNWKDKKCKNCAKYKQFNSKFSLNRTSHYYKKLENAMKDYPVNNIVITGVSPWVSDRIKSSSIYKGLRVETVLNPVDEFYFEKVDIKKKDKQILYVTPDFYDYDKGGDSLIEIANKLPNYSFILVTAKDQEIKGLPNNVTVLKKVNKDTLRDLYHESRCTLLLSKNETFSMVAAESIACGTPVIGYKNGGTDSWLIYGGFFVDKKDIKGLISYIEHDNPMVVFDIKGKIENTKDYLRLYQ